MVSNWFFQSYLDESISAKSIIPIRDKFNPHFHTIMVLSWLKIQQNDRTSCLGAIS